MGEEEWLRAPSPRPASLPARPAPAPEGHPRRVTTRPLSRSALERRPPIPGFGGTCFLFLSPFFGPRCEHLLSSALRSQAFPTLGPSQGLLAGWRPRSAATPRARSALMAAAAPSNVQERLGGSWSQGRACGPCAGRGAYFEKKTTKGTFGEAGGAGTR